MNTTILILELLIILCLYLYYRYLRDYFKQKGKNLATKEDISEISDRIESVKAKYIAEIEKLKADILSKTNIHQIRYKKEYDILYEISEKIILFKIAARNLRPAIDTHDSKKSKEERFQERAKKYYNAGRNFFITYESRRPFYSEELYKELEEFHQVLWKEFVQYKFGELHGEQDDYWEKALENVEEIEKSTNKVQEIIRDRIKYWEDLDLKNLKS